MQERILLVLDLDETLIHASENKLEYEHNFEVSNYFIYTRPYLTKFLNEVFQYYDLAIWSSGNDEYVNQIVEKIKPENIEFKFIWGQSKCTYKRNLCLNQYEYEKRLEKVKRKGFKLEKILIIDDSPEKCKTNYGNAVYVSEFIGNKNDIELNLLSKYLFLIKDSDNVRKFEKRNWRFLIK